MPKYEVEVYARYVRTRRTKITVEAENEGAAENLAVQKVTDFLAGDRPVEWASEAPELLDDTFAGHVKEIAA